MHANGRATLQVWAILLFSLAAVGAGAQGGATIKLE